jgi:hypothetical protein
MVPGTGDTAFLSGLYFVIQDGVGNSSVKSVPPGKAGVNQQELRAKSASEHSFQSPFFEDYKYSGDHHGEAEEIVPTELLFQIQNGKN